MRFFGASTADVYVLGKRVKLDPSTSIGKGGEADVFQIGKGLALKVFKGPDHPDLAGDPAARAGASERLDAHQAKLPLFPRSLPDRAVSPIDLATDKTGARILGYTMPLITGAEVLFRYSDPSFRAQAVTANALGPLLADLHRTVESLHARGIVIGDFNDLNVLVRGDQAFIIDCDSFQYGGFPTGVYTERFLDPLLADPLAPRPLPAKPFNQASDWYAFAAIAMQTLLCVGPYGGVYRPKSAADRIPHDARPLRRITVFHPEVVYPRPAIPLRVLPDDLLHALFRTFREDDRRPLPRSLLENLFWTRCSSCGAEHARSACPRCQKVSKPAQALVETSHGAVTRELVRGTKGRFVVATMSAGALRYLVYEDGAYVREDGRRVLEGDLRPDFRFFLCGEDTVVASGPEVVVLGSDGARGRFSTDCAHGEPVVATTGRYQFRALGGSLLRRGGATGLLSAQDVRFGEVLPGQTRLWAGERLGFGLYRAGSLSVAFVFETEHPGLSEVKLPYLSGQVLGYEVIFGEDRVWVLIATQVGGRTVHLAVMLRPDGTIEATARGEAGDGSWLGVLGGKCAVGRALLAATDTGVVKVEGRATDLTVTKRFADTEPFVTAATALHAGPDGLYAVSPHAIWRLRTN